VICKSVDSALSFMFTVCVSPKDILFIQIIFYTGLYNTDIYLFR